MANYNSVEDLFNANTNNMSVLINNISYDDNYYTLTAPSFLNNKTMYVSGNSWIGIGSNSEHLKVNRRDCKMWYLYSETGQVKNINFFKLRWSGYSQYNYTSSTYKQIYDIVFWENGSISLKMINVPTSYNNGTYSFTDPNKGTIYSYSVNSANPHVTFQYNENNQTYTVLNSIIELKSPTYQLIKHQENYYSYDENLNPILLEGDLINLFKTYGKESFQLSPFKNFDNLQIIVWNSSSNFNFETYTISGIPNPQIIEYNPIDIKTNGGISKIGFPNCQDISFQISSDGGNTWKYYNNEWIEIDNFDIGMSIKTIEALTEIEWAEFSESENCIIRAKLNSSISSIGNMYVKYISVS